MVELFQQTIKEYFEDFVPRLAAALAYYTAFSLAPLLVIIVALVGFIFGDGVAQERVTQQISAFVGPEVGEFSETLIENATEQNNGVISTIISVIALLVGSTTVFMQLQAALNEIWGVKSDETGLMNMLQKRVLSFGMIVVIGFLLLVSLVTTSVIASLSEYAATRVPLGTTLMQIISFSLSLAVATLMFALIYKVLPDAEIKWADVWVGAVFTGILFSVGRQLLGLYLGNGSSTSVYGAAGAMALVLLWVYWSSQIVLIGAEFTQVYARLYGTKIVSDAVQEENQQAGATA